MTLSAAIKAAKLDWVNTNIEANFSYEKPRNADYKLFHFDCDIESEDAVKEIEKTGYSPATLSELLAYAEDGWNGKDWVVALGSVARVDLGRSVPSLDGGGARRGLHLDLWGRRWGRRCRFLACVNKQAVVPLSDDKEPCKHEINYCPDCGQKIR